MHSGGNLYHRLQANPKYIHFRNSIYCHGPNSKESISPRRFDKLERNVCNLVKKANHCYYQELAGTNGMQKKHTGVSWYQCRKNTQEMEKRPVQFFCFPGVTPEALRQRPEVDGLYQCPLCSSECRQVKSG